MQIASQVYKIKTAANALAFFADGNPVYITKRFDYKADGSKIKQDDFITFGTRIGVLPKKLASIIEMFATEQPKVYELIENSFLEEKVQRMYKQSYQERLHHFQRSDKFIEL